MIHYLAAAGFVVAMLFAVILVAFLAFAFVRLVITAVFAISDYRHRPRGGITR